MDTFFQQFQLIHMLLPYFPATNRTLFSYILYYLEFQHLMKAIQVEQDLLAVAPPNPKFPEGDALVELLSKNLPAQEAQKIKQMMDMMKMMETMKDMDIFQNLGSVFSETASPPPPPPPPAPKNNSSNHTESKSSFGAGLTPELFKNMMSPKQQELFEQYQTMFQSNPPPKENPNPYDY